MFGGCCLPHARGGVSQFKKSLRWQKESSPRPWGCFRAKKEHRASKVVFPTPVGVFPPRPDLFEATEGLPHARGGVSQTTIIRQMLRRSSPRPWGCFCPVAVACFCSGVFPTPVGVFLRLKLLTVSRKSLPHARGGVSFFSGKVSSICVSSPRPWGCFRLKDFKRSFEDVFPTPVGCFWDEIACFFWHFVFPTPVGVFLVSRVSCIP